MKDREKVMRGAECCTKDVDDPYSCEECPYLGHKPTKKGCITVMLEDTLALLKEQEAVPPKHIHEEYPAHDWERNADGEIDTFAFDTDYHNGPVCKRCGYSFCVYCDPDGYEKKPCIIDKYRCPSCDVMIRKGQKYCQNCGKKVKWDG